MNMQEYLKVRNYTYLEYCDYLQSKYGIGKADYMDKDYKPISKCKRGEEGLFAHHKYENKASLLSQSFIAEFCPFEWQAKENIVYCDYLEHLLLHVLICKYPENIEDNDIVGIQGAICFIMPEISKFYSGGFISEHWKIVYRDRIISDKDVYFAILKQLNEIELKENEQTHNQIKNYRQKLNDEMKKWDLHS